MILQGDILSAGKIGCVHAVVQDLGDWGTF